MDEKKLDHYRTVLLEQLRQQTEAARGCSTLTTCSSPSARSASLGRTGR